MAISREYILLSIGLIIAVALVVAFTLQGTNKSIMAAEEKSREVPKADFEIKQPPQNYKVIDLPGEGDNVMIPFEIVVTKIPSEVIVQVDSNNWGISDVYIEDNVTGQPGSINPKLEGTRTVNIGGHDVTYGIRAVIPTEDVADGTTLKFYVQLLQYRDYTKDDTIKLQVSINGVAETIYISTDYRTEGLSG